MTEGTWTHVQAQQFVLAGQEMWQSTCHRCGFVGTDAWPTEAEARLKLIEGGHMCFWERVTRSDSEGRFEVELPGWVDGARIASLEFTLDDELCFGVSYVIAGGRLIGGVAGPGEVVISSLISP